MSDLSFDASAIPETAEQAQALISHWEQPESNVPTAPAVETAAPQETTEPEYVIKYRGNEEKLPLSKLLSFAQQGRDYSEKMRDFRVQREGFEKSKLENETKWKGLEEKLSRYSAIEEYTKKDPTWWEHLNTSYQERLAKGQGDSASPPNNPVVESLTKEVGELRQFVSSWKEREEDSKLDTTVSDYRSKNSQFDWNNIDENGIDLEGRILKHAVDNGIKDFTIAANSFLFDEHIKRAELKAKEDVVKEVKKTTKLGLGPVTNTPSQKLQAVKNVSSKSWDEIETEALKSVSL